MISKKHIPHLKITFLTLFSTVLFWAIFYFNIPKLLGFSDTSIHTLFANYDGPNYMIIAKCGYDTDCIRQSFSLPQPLEYYPAHLPAYPLMIKALDIFFPAPVAMLFVTLAGSIFLNLVFYQLIKTFTNSSKALWLTFLFNFFPARFFILRNIGAPETWFIGFTLLSILLFKKEKYLYSAIFAALSQALKSPGILLFGAFSLIFIQKLITKQETPAILFKKFILYILVPLTVLIIFAFYKYQTGDFLAYFHSGDNFHLNPLPFLVFAGNRSWVHSIWLEDIIYIFLFALLAIQTLFKKYQKSNIISIYPALFLLSTLFVAHRDISRYVAPIYPFAFLAFEKYLSSKTFKFAFWVILPAIILYSINFCIGNIAPIADWTPYL
ncbi:hypothetical protein KKC08_00770 [Patescibacteria group bacterium]|nr:hypothetical protein [Patescibacteria group bacterium]MCG2701905.1 hypothetical protein [Candidatus Parcubacteria bacterium]MBU4265201.1 hypothetical protein [Patescibacteria group bacterium]MBU4390765.1 hypothetical protein [Patescibacteria group bacterium]MBU4396687.1 hypothetical protein [Patescibacteria group bacterium]